MMTEEDLQRFVELDNAARHAKAAIATAASVRRARERRSEDQEPVAGEEALLKAADEAVAEYQRLANAYGATALPKAAPKADDEPNDLPAEHRAVFRGLHRRIKEGELITLGKTKATRLHKIPGFLKAVTA
jgi:hypothetical protein